MKLAISFVTILAALGALAGTALAAPKSVTGRAMVFDRGFDVVYWDSVNGERVIARGLEPSLSSDGRYIAYLDRDASGAACDPVVLYDVRERRNLPLAGINGSDCIHDPRVSANGRYIVFEGAGTTPGDPSGIYLYDVVNQRRVGLPAPVNSPSTEGSPSLSDDGRLLALVSGRSSFDSVLVADISAVPSGGAATLVPLPGFPIADPSSPREAEISGDGNTIAYAFGPELGRSVGIYDRSTSTISTPASLAQPGDTFQPGLNAAGNLIVVARTPAGANTSQPHLFDRAGGVLSRLRFLDSSVSEDEPDIADPVPLVDTTPPKIKLRCKARARKPRRVTCLVRSSEAVKGTLVVKRGKRAVAKRKQLRFNAAGKRRVAVRTRVALPKGAKLTATAKVKDSVGRRTSRRTRFRVR